MSANTAPVLFPALTARGHRLDAAPDRLGLLRDSRDAVANADALRERLREDGYLYLPGYLDREAVLDARRDIVARLAEVGWLDPASPPLEAVATAEIPGKPMDEKAGWARESEALQRLLYTGRMMALYRRLLGGEVRHFDYTWLRTVPPGKGTAPHGDSVFMGRGTLDLYTAWTPLGDISFDLGGLLILEGSHRLDRIKETYGRQDVDSYCENREDAALYAAAQRQQSGALSDDPVALREQLGGRWLTAEFRAGDLLTFGMFTLHASLDNRSDRIRLSTDSRYQLASEAVDERWVGERPIGHGSAAKRGRIC